MKVMSHLIAGYPDKKGYEKAVKGLKDGGADILELQIPFSDPTADGPVITAACEDAIKTGFKVSEIFDYIKISQRSGFKEIFIMTYANIAYSYGIEKFIKDMKDANVKGLIIPDLPIEDEEGFYDICFKERIIAVPVAVINMLPERVKLLKSKPFKDIYVAIRVGTTGQETEIDNSVKNFLKEFKEYTIYAGFGIRSSKQIKALEGISDIAVVGSYFTNTIKESSANNEDIYKKIKSAMQTLKNG